MVSGLKRFLLLMQPDCEYRLIHINGIRANPHQQPSRILGVFICAH